MTEQKAINEAQKRWGRRGGVQIRAGHWPFWVGVYSEVVDFWPYGCGNTFEEAFEAADNLRGVNSEVGIGRNEDDGKENASVLPG